MVTIISCKNSWNNLKTTLKNILTCKKKFNSEKKNLNDFCNFNLKKNN